MEGPARRGHPGGRGPRTCTSLSSLPPVSPWLPVGQTLAHHRVGEPACGSICLRVSWAESKVETGGEWTWRGRQKALIPPFGAYFFEHLGCSGSRTNTADKFGVTSGLLDPKLEWPFSLEYLPTLTSLGPQCTFSSLVKWVRSKVTIPVPLSL